LLALRASPHQISFGFALGVFIGIFPTFGLGGLIIFALIVIWKFNVPAALLGTTIGNPLFAPLWISLSCLITGISPSQLKPPGDALHQVLAHYSQIWLRYILGNLAVSLVAAFIAYFVLIKLVIRYRGWKDRTDASNTE
jgi:uncharacterized protein (DUF2062 family)